jgi:hypothetical protein
MKGAASKVIAVEVLPTYGMKGLPAKLRKTRVVVLEDTESEYKSYFIVSSYFIKEFQVCSCGSPQRMASKEKAPNSNFQADNPPSADSSP